MPIFKSRHLILTIHDVDRHPGDASSRKIPEFVHDLAVKVADEVVVHGEYLKKQMIKKYNLKEDKVHSVVRGDYGYFL